MKIFDGQRIESLTWEELSQLRYSVSEWYFPVATDVPLLQKSHSLESYVSVKGHLDYMISVCKTVTGPGGEKLTGLFGEYELPNGTFVYTVYDSRGSIWKVYNVARVFRAVRRPLDSAEEFVAAQWAAAEENAS